MLLWVMGVGFGNTYIVSWRWNVSRVIQRLYGWVYKTLKLSPLVVNIVLWLWLRDWILWVVNFRLPFYEICVQNQWEHKILRPSRGLRQWQPSSITIIMEYLLAFQYWYCELCVKTDQGEAKKIVLLIFVLWRCLDRRWMRGGGVGQKVLFKARWNLGNLGQGF